MNNIKILDSALILIIFIIISIVFKLLSIFILGTIFSNIFAANAELILYFPVGIGIFATGIVVGKLIRWRIRVIPLYHALVIACLAFLFKLYRPELDSISTYLSLTYAMLTFISIILGVYITKNKA